jgi:hypothetical protein
MTEPELRQFFSDLARKVEDSLPPGPSSKGKCLFALIVADTTEPGVGQYVSNVQRGDMIRLLRETADRLERREDVPRSLGQRATGRNRRPGGPPVGPALTRLMTKGVGRC